MPKNGFCTFKQDRIFNCNIFVRCTTSEDGQIKSISFAGVKAPVPAQQYVMTISGELIQIAPKKITFENLRDSEELLPANEWADGLMNAEKYGRVTVVEGARIIRSPEKFGIVRHWREIADPSVCRTAAVRECVERFSFALSFKLPENNLVASTGKTTQMSPLTTDCKCLER